MYRHVIWDWNGTLVDDTWLCLEILNNLLAAHGLNRVGLPEYRELFDFPVKDYYGKLGFDISDASFQKLSDKFFADFGNRFHECKLRDNAIETITQLNRTGISQSILSAMEQKALLKMVAERFDTGLFLNIQGISDINAAGKISEGINLVGRIETDPASILLIGDTTHDYVVAKSLGTDCILLADGHHSRRRLAATGANVANSLSEITSLLSCPLPV